MSIFIRVMAFMGLLLIVFASGFNWQNVFLLLMIVVFFIGKPWYSSIGENRNL